MRSLSGGERNRLLLARLFARPANVLVLDEPTNDLDIDTLELLEDLLQNYDGTVFLVSHDRTFLDNVVTSTIAFEGDGPLARIRGRRAGLADAVASAPARSRSSAPQPRRPPRRGPRRRDARPRPRRQARRGPQEAQLQGTARTRDPAGADRRRWRGTEADHEILALDGGAIYASDASRAAELAERHARIDEELMAALERWEALGQRPSGAFVRRGWRPAADLRIPAVGSRRATWLPSMHRRTRLLSPRPRAGALTLCAACWPSSCRLGRRLRRACRATPSGRPRAPSPRPTRPRSASWCSSAGRRPRRAATPASVLLDSVGAAFPAGWRWSSRRSAAWTCSTTRSTPTPAPRCCCSALRDAAAARRARAHPARRLQHRSARTPRCCAWPSSRMWRCGCSIRCRARASLLGRIFNSLNDIGAHPEAHAQQAVHRRQRLGIAGGRNLGDAYFGTDDKSNFVDLDVLAAGRIVRDMSASFDALLEQRAAPTRCRRWCRPRNWRNCASARRRQGEPSAGR